MPRPMDGLLETVQQWIPVDVLIGLTVASAIGFVGTLFAIPMILVRLPADYFDTRIPRHWMKDHHPALRLLGWSSRTSSALSSSWQVLLCSFCRGRACSRC